MLATALYMQQGTPYVYQGQEIGMTDYPWTSFDEMEDVLVTYVLNVVNKVAPFLRNFVFKVLKKRARDNGRTPMQWNAEENAGFTKGKPWLVINPNYKEVNAENAMNDPDSIFHYFQKIIKFRLGNDIIIKGTYKENYAKSNDIFCYERSYHGET